MTERNNKSNNHHPAAENSSANGRGGDGSKSQCTKERTQQRHQQQHDLLLTRTALELSLSPPRAPPFGTAQHALYTGKNPSSASWAQHYHVRENADEIPRIGPHETLRQRVLQQWMTNNHQNNKHNKNIRRRRHPHLPETSANAATRFIGAWWSVAHQNRFRDSGSFWHIVDGIVAATAAPAIALSSPTAAVPAFVRLTRQCRHIQCGPHPRQYLHLYLPNRSETNIKNNNYNYNSGPANRLIFFVHGGAWGFGHPWMYRLVAAPFLQEGWAVAVAGYRTYPDGCVADQVHDLELAAAAIQRSPDLLLCGTKTNTAVTLMGHSSGAHIALLMLAERAKKQLLPPKLRPDEDPSLPLLENRLQFDSFVGVSGPYDISHHFDYEAARGVEELSPMKPVNGYTREAFRQNSPALLLRDALAAVPTEKESTCDELLPAMALLHGIEDDTVPFTATAEAARVLRSCGLTRVQEIYVPETGHQDAVIQIMLGGRMRDATIDWIKGLSPSSSAAAAAETVGQQVLVRSRL